VELCAIGATVPDILPGIAARPAPSTAQLSAVVAEAVVVVLAVAVVVAAVSVKPTVSSVIVVAIWHVIVKTRIIGVTGT